MSSGFIKLNRAGGYELLEEDPKAFLLLSHIALRARREALKYSRYSLKANQAFVGDPEKIGLSRQEYRNAKKRLKKYGLATFESTNRGTIATLTSVDVYDINAQEEPSKFPIEMIEKEPSNNQLATSKESSQNLPTSNQPPLTRMKEGQECKKATTPVTEGVLYECLQSCVELSTEEKSSLLKYPEERVKLALEWAGKTSIKKSLTGAIHWHCKQEIPPAPNIKQENQTPQQAMAWEYNRLLEEESYEELAGRNQAAIPDGHLWIVQEREPTTVTLKGALETLKNDLKESKEVIMRKKA